MAYGSASISRSEFLKSERADVLRQELTEMTKNPLYNTRVTSLLDHDASFFVEKHMKYMSDHLKMDHIQYVRNLKLMTKIG